MSYDLDMSKCDINKASDGMNTRFCVPHMICIDVPSDHLTIASLTFLSSKLDYSYHIEVFHISRGKSNQSATETIPLKHVTFLQQGIGACSSIP